MGLITWAAPTGWLAFPCCRNTLCLQGFWPQSNHEARAAVETNTHRHRNRQKPANVHNTRNTCVSNRGAIKRKNYRPHMKKTSTHRLGSWSCGHRGRWLRLCCSGAFPRSLVGGGIVEVHTTGSGVCDGIPAWRQISTGCGGLRRWHGTRGTPATEGIVTLASTAIATTASVLLTSHAAGG